VNGSSSNSHSPSPPSSSNAFSLVSSEQDNPSTSGCSSEQSAKAKTQKELFKTLKELKTHLPSEKRSKGKSSTINTLKYALRCVKQVKANEEYYQMLMVNDSQPPGFDVSSYTLEEINRITSEYTLKNTDIFAVAVSLITGKIVYISDQAATILNCKREVFNNANFVEFLTPKDVSVFYSFTTPYRLPSWSMCTGAESSPTECMQEKSFFCRIRSVTAREGDLQYYPFRMTPYLMKVQDAELAEEQFCCLLLAERVHSGYEAPRIPPDKRIFTTTHTPNCVFQDVDERAVPLLGYLPQDLIGTPLLLKLHPSDRPLMLALHRKILQYAGQPFDHSSIRFCARNGEYVTIDTSWSSFVNPWSRKVSFVIGRHKVRMGPVNEDVFAVPAFHGGKIMDSDIQEISEQIHRLLLQPIHNMGSSGYGSHGSNGSHEQPVSVGSSSESNGNMMVTAAEEPDKAKPLRTFQEICKGVHMQKSQDSQVSLQLPSLLPPRPELKKSTDTAQRSPTVRLKDSAPPLQVRDGTAAVADDITCKDQASCSYQQISCLDSVIRYLESCNIPVTVKRKYQFSSNTTSSNSDDSKKGSEDGLSNMKAPKKPLAPLTLPSKAESVVSITSQCSYSSTIVHVGDKKPQPESGEFLCPIQRVHSHPSLLNKVCLTDVHVLCFFSTEIIGDVAESPAPPALPVSTVSPPSQEKEAYKRLGLTKQVLAAHTQKEEQVFLNRCRELRHARSVQKDCSKYLHRQKDPANAKGTQGFIRSQTHQHLKPDAVFFSLLVSQVECLGDGAHSDGNSSSCDLLDILLQEDSHSGTGSATSGSMGSGSRSGSGSGCNGCGTSGSGGSGSSNTSKYFGSIDSLEHDPKGKVKPKTRSKGGSNGGQPQAKVSSPGEEEHFNKYVLQEPLWLLMANADDKVMMTYQLPTRDIQKVLREDKERLRQMRKSQPHFSSDQRRELLDEHPWMRRGGLPTAVNVKVSAAHTSTPSQSMLNIAFFCVCLCSGMYVLRGRSRAHPGRPVAHGHGRAAGRGAEARRT
uniref:Period circadian protein homolog 2 n=1 Tax=Scophthalmus maximus TaxID=52904 RepID=A0A8D3C639_SCOMX